MRAATGLLLASLAAACLHAAPRRAERRPLGEEGEVLVFLQPLPGEAGRLGFELSALQAVGADGREVPLEVRPDRPAGPSGLRRQRLLGAARLPPGTYAELTLRIARATLGDGAAAADLLVTPEPIRVPAPFTVRAGAATVIWLRADGPAPAGDRVAFVPGFTAKFPERPTPQAAGWVSAAGAHAVLAFDTRLRTVAGAVPTGREPRGLALDGRRNRIYAALAGEDEIAVLDAAAGEVIARVRLEPRDEPRELALTPDGRTLLCLAPGTDHLVFVDAEALVETGRLRVAERPVALRLDREGVRAYVLGTRANGLTVVDVANRAVVTSGALEAEPRWSALDRAGARLHVVHRDSQYLTTVALPTLTTTRTFVGLGAERVAVDRRTDLVYLSRRDGARLEVLEPLSLMRVDEIPLPAPATAMVIDDVENALFALLPSIDAAVVVDLTSKRVVARFDLPEAPHDLVLAGAR